MPRFAAVLLGIGFWGVFASQLYGTFLLLLVSTGYSFLLQLVIGAPIFEEMLKFGLALVLVCMLGSGRGAGRAVVLVLRAVVALACGFAFGWFEHEYVYSTEEVDFPLEFAVGGQQVRLEIYWREVFHAGSALLSMVMYGVLERLPDTRTRWFATLPASFLHYVNNALAIPVSLLLGETAAYGMSVSISIALFALTAMVAVAPALVRAVAARQAAKHFPTALPAVPPVRALAARPRT